MRCYVCDVSLERTVTDPLTGKIKHCSACDEVIQENLMSLERRGTEPEENTGELPLLENDWDDMPFDHLDPRTWTIDDDERSELFDME